MSDIDYCDIDPYDRTSWEILCFLSKDKLKTKTEVEYWQKYRMLSSAHSDKNTKIRMYNSIILQRENRIKQVNRDDVKDADNLTKSCIQYICHLQGLIDKESAHLLTYENELAKLENSKPIQDILNRERKDGEEIEMRFAKFTFKEKNKTQNTKPLSQNKWHYILSGVIGLILGVLYLVGMAKLPYAYYQLLRFISFISIPAFLYSYWNIPDEDDPMGKINITHIITGVIWILFNPLFPIHLNKELWMSFDFVSAMIFFALDIYLIVLYRRKNKHTHKKTTEIEEIQLDDEALKDLIQYFKNN